MSAVTAIGMLLGAGVHAAEFRQRVVGDGIIVSARAGDGVIELSWRFSHHLPSSVAGFSANVDGIGLRVLGARRYPEGASTALLFLTSTAPRAPARSRDFVRAAATLFAAQIASHHAPGLAFAGDDLEWQLIVPSRTDLILNRISDGDAAAGDPRLFASLSTAIRDLAAFGADRRAVFVFSDGVSADPADSFAEIAELANQSDVSVFVLVAEAQSGLTAAAGALKSISELTGGWFIRLVGDPPEIDLVKALNPFGQIDSGLRVGLDISQVPYALVMPPRVSLAVSFEDGSSIDLNFRLSEHTRLAQVLTGLNESERFAAVGVAVTTIVLVPILVALVVLRRKRRIGEQWGRLTSAADVAPFELCGPQLVIGRGSQADIRLADATVGRRHAILRRDRNGVIQIQDLRSTNGITVNGSSVDRAILSNGDVIGIGRVELKLAVGTQGKHAT